MGVCLTYEETVTWGAGQYADVLARLRAERLHMAEFVQTGGMCAAIEVQLEAGYRLLITDAEDILSWCRADQRGWRVGMYAPERDGDGDSVAACAQDDWSDLDTLIRLVVRVLEEGTSAIRGPASDRR